MYSRPLQQSNRAPMGFGQQRGSSPYLDRQAIDTMWDEPEAPREPGTYQPSPWQTYAQQRGTAGPSSQFGAGQSQSAAPPPPQNAPPPPPPPPPPPAPTGGAALTPTPYQAAMEQIRAAYKEHLGRDGTDAELASHLGAGYDPYRLAFSINSIKNSPEAALRRTGPAVTGATTPPGNTPPGGTPPASYTGGPLGQWGTGDIPGAENLAGGSHASTGVNTAGWGTQERGTNSIKNTAMKIATRYPPKPSSIDAWLNDPDTKKFFPNAKKVGFDKVDFGDGNPVDILKNADPNSDTAEAWAWMPDNEQGAAAAAPGAGAPASNSALPPGFTNDLPTTADAVGRGLDLDASSIDALLASILAQNNGARARGEV